MTTDSVPAPMVQGDRCRCGHTAFPHHNCHILSRTVCQISGCPCEKWNPVPVGQTTLTTEEMASLSTWDDGSYHCPCPDGCVCSDEEKVHLFDAVAYIVASRLVDAATPAASVKASGTPACRTGDLTAQVSIPAAEILALADQWKAEMESFDTSKPDARVDAAVTRLHISKLRALVAAAEQPHEPAPLDAMGRSILNPNYQDPRPAAAEQADDLLGPDPSFGVPPWTSGELLVDEAEQADKGEAADTPRCEGDDWPFTKDRPLHLWEGNFTPPAAPPEPQELFCTCGHGQSFHDTRTRTGIFCTGDEDCFCVVFAVATQAARVPVNDEAEGLTKEERSEIRHAIQEGDTAGVLVYVESLLAARQGGNSDE